QIEAEALARRDGGIESDVAPMSAVVDVLRAIAFLADVQVRAHAQPGIWVVVHVDAEDLLLARVDASFEVIERADLRLGIHVQFFTRTEPHAADQRVRVDLDIVALLVERARTDLAGSRRQWQAPAAGRE